MARTFIKMPTGVKRGEAFEVKAMIEHPQHSGFRLDHVGKPVPRHIVTTFTCEYAGRQVFRATLHPAIATNPYVTFFVIAGESGYLELTWIDDLGTVTAERAMVTVV